MICKEKNELILVNTLFSGREDSQKYLKIKIGYKRAKKSWISFTSTQREEKFLQCLISGDPKKHQKYTESGEERKDLAFKNTNLWCPMETSLRIVRF